MKLAEALMERADLGRKIEQLRVRITDNILVQDGEEPAENPAELMKELDDAVARLEVLIAAINKTNSSTMVDGSTITDLIAKKDAKICQLGAYREFVREASQNTNRARGTEIKIRSVVGVAGMQKKVDALAKEVRLLDNTLQMTNWQTELIEK